MRKLIAFLQLSYLAFTISTVLNENSRFVCRAYIYLYPNLPSFGIMSSKKVWLKVSVFTWRLPTNQSDVIQRNIEDCQLMKVMSYKETLKCRKVVQFDWLSNLNILKQSHIHLSIDSTGHKVFTPLWTYKSKGRCNAEFFFFQSMIEMKCLKNFLRLRLMQTWRFDHIKPMK